MRRRTPERVQEARAATAVDADRPRAAAVVVQHLGVAVRWTPSCQGSRDSSAGALARQRRRGRGASACRRAHDRAPAASHPPVEQADTGGGRRRRRAPACEPDGGAVGRDPAGRPVRALGRSTRSQRRFSPSPPPPSTSRLDRAAVPACGRARRSRAEPSAWRRPATVGTTMRARHAHSRVAPGPSSAGLDSVAAAVRGPTPPPPRRSAVRPRSRRAATRRRRSTGDAAAARARARRAPAPSRGLAEDPRRVAVTNASFTTRRFRPRGALRACATTTTETTDPGGDAEP